VQGGPLPRRSAARGRVLRFAGVGPSPGQSPGRGRVLRGSSDRRRAEARVGAGACEVRGRSITAPKRGSGPRPAVRSRAPSPRRSVGRIRVHGPQGGPSRHRSAGRVRILRFTGRLEPPPRRSADRVRDLLTARPVAAPERGAGGEVCSAGRSVRRAEAQLRAGSCGSQGSVRRRAEARAGAGSCEAARSVAGPKPGSGPGPVRCRGSP
jgi:hypothetical protein